MAIRWCKSEREEKESKSENERKDDEETFLSHDDEHTYAHTLYIYNLKRTRRNLIGYFLSG